MTSRPKNEGKGLKRGGREREIWYVIFKGLPQNIILISNPKKCAGAGGRRMIYDGFRDFIQCTLHVFHPADFLWTCFPLMWWRTFCHFVLARLEVWFQDAEVWERFFKRFFSCDISVERGKTLRDTFCPRPRHHSLLGPPSGVVKGT